MNFPWRAFSNRSTSPSITTKPYPEWVWYTFYLSELHFYWTIFCFVFCKTIFILEFSTFQLLSTLFNLLLKLYILHILCSLENYINIWHRRFFEAANEKNNKKKHPFTSCDTQDGVNTFDREGEIFVKCKCPINSVYLCPVNICT